MDSSGDIIEIDKSLFQGTRKYDRGRLIIGSYPGGVRSGVRVVDGVAGGAGAVTESLWAEWPEVLGAVAESLSAEWPEVREAVAGSLWAEWPEVPSGWRSRCGRKGPRPTP